MADQKVVELNPDLLEPNPLQPRGNITPESISNLVESIKNKGILEPLIVAKTPAGYQIVSGERRWRAAKILGLEKVPVIIREMKPEEMIEAVITENIHREELNPLDRARAFKKLHDDFGFSWSQIAEKIGKSVPYVVNTVKLLSLPDALKDGLLSGLITEGHARALSGIGDTRLMIEAYKIVLREQASVRRAEEIARQIKIEMKKGKEEKEVLLGKEELERISQEFKKALPFKNLEVEITQSRVRLSLRFLLDGNPRVTTAFISRLLRLVKEGKGS